MSPKRSRCAIGTHDGTFHCDEALGCFLLQQLDEFKDAEIVRSRDPAVLAELDVVIDVGGVYNAEEKRFDHHQRGFEEVFGHGHTVKLSSAGLVYKHYGMQIIATLTGLDPSDGVCHTIWLKVYKTFIEPIDGIDNGVTQWVSDEPPRYRLNTDLSSRVGKLLPAWNQDFGADTLMAKFQDAMKLTGTEFTACVHHYSNAWLPGRKYVVEAVNGRFDVHASGEILKLPCYCPWKDHLYDIEVELKIDPLPKYCLYADEKGNWRIQCVGLNNGTFENRRSLPAAWRGVRDSELDAVSGIDGCIFVHAGGFIGGNKTLEGAQAMAIKALEIE